jgi:hypothetical protein
MKLDDLKTGEPVTISPESGLNCHEAYLMRFCGIPYVIGLSKGEAQWRRFYSEVKDGSCVLQDGEFHVYKYNYLSLCRDGNMKDKARGIFAENRGKQ